MVGDREVAIAELPGTGDHLLEAREPVGQVRVRVEVSLELLHREEGQELAGDRGLDLATVLAERGLDHRHPEPLVDALLGLGREQLARLRVEQPVLAELEALPDGDLADRMLCGFEPVK